MEKTEILDKFDANMGRNSIEIAQTWEKREKSEFGQKLIQLANCYDEIFSKNNKQNMFSLINDAYFFDGEKHECIEKLRKELNKNESSLSDEAVRLFIELESLADLDIDDTGINEFNNQNKGDVVSERSTTLDFGNIDDIEFILVNETKDYKVRGKKIICKYDAVYQTFYVDFTTNKLSDDEAGYIGWKLYPDYSVTSKKDLCADMNVILYDKTNDKEYNIMQLKNAFVNGFENNDNIIKIMLSADWYLINKDDEDQVANYVRHEISNAFYVQDPIDAYNERMKAVNYEDDF